MIGYAFCGSFCTLSHSLAALRQLCADGYDVLPIMSEKTYETDTRFWRAEDFRRAVRDLCQKDIVHTIVDAEPLGPRTPLDALVLSPCTGNTLAKIAQGITDSSVTMAAKAHLRRDRTTLIALASNDAMSANLANIAELLLRKNVYFVPMRQDDPEKKPHSLVADFTQLPECLKLACQSHQRCPLFL
ncbi:MAG: dipicolinate synthase subunit B [Clostridia bacterium]|jgi:dipicolinate synthase subunit B|nr:dipicolinate synthase subunit B [Clostridia bacterium]MBQ5800724.1 dipicolinate synthase subunit B [Clostridia bacterium]